MWYALSSKNNTDLSLKLAIKLAQKELITVSDLVEIGAFDLHGDEDAILETLAGLVKG